jgi:hypothetical protein
MARRSRMSVQKRKRERDKAERAAMKREDRSQKEPQGEGGESSVATVSDLEGYGLAPEPDEEDAELG